MRIAEFELERYFARWEFAVRHILCASDIQAFSLRELLALADGGTREKWDALTLGYTESLGHPLLRAEIATLYENVSADDVLVTVGAEEAIFLTMQGLLAPGDHAVVVWPAYQSLFEVARSIGAELTLVPLEARDWSLDVDVVERSVRPNTRVIVVNSPHSPTGALLERPAFDRLVALAEHRGITLFSDEVYRGLELDPRTRLPAAVDRGPHAVSLGVMSKTFALAGLRVGWIATHDSALRQRVAALKDYTTICGSAPSELLALIALRARDAVMARSHAIIGDNLPALDALFAEFADQIAWVRPRGASVGFPRLVAHDVDVDAWCARLIESEGVLLLPGSRFLYPGPHFRIGFGRTDLRAAAERFAAFLQRERRRSG